MDGGWVEMLPSGRRYRVVGGLSDKSEEYNPTSDGIYVDVYYHEDDVNSAYFLRVARRATVDPDEPEWEKYYEFGDHGLVEVENLHIARGNGEIEVERSDE